MSSHVPLPPNRYTSIIIPSNSNNQSLNLPSSNQKKKSSGTRHSCPSADNITVSPHLYSNLPPFFSLTLDYTHWETTPGKRSCVHPIVMIYEDCCRMCRYRGPTSKYRGSDPFCSAEVMPALMGALVLIEAGWCGIVRAPGIDLYVNQKWFRSWVGYVIYGVLSRLWIHFFREVHRIAFMKFIV